MRSDYVRKRPELLSTYDPEASSKLSFWLQKSRQDGAFATSAAGPSVGRVSRLRRSGFGC